MTGTLYYLMRSLYRRGKRGPENLHYSPVHTSSRLWSMDWTELPLVVTHVFFPPHQAPLLLTSFLPWKLVVFTCVGAVLWVLPNSPSFVGQEVSITSLDPPLVSWGCWRPTPSPSSWSSTALTNLCQLWLKYTLIRVIAFMFCWIITINSSRLC